MAGPGREGLARRTFPPMRRCRRIPANGSPSRPGFAMRRCHPGSPAPAMASREAFTGWVSNAPITEACVEGMTPGPTPVRRLNRTQYASTVRDLLNLHIDVSVALPGRRSRRRGLRQRRGDALPFANPCGEVSDAAKAGAQLCRQKDPRSRARSLIAKPGPGITAEQAARQILEAFLPRAFRRPAKPAEMQMYQTLFDSARANKQTFDDSVLYALSGVLISPPVSVPCRAAKPGRAGSSFGRLLARNPALLLPFGTARRIVYCWHWRTKAN